MISVKKITFLIFALFILILLFFYGTRFRQGKSKAGTAHLIQSESINETSYIEETPSTLSISLQSETGFLYKSQTSGFAAADEFLQSEAEVNLDSIPSATQVKGASTVKNVKKKLLPKNIRRNLRLTRSLKDKDDKLFQKFHLTAEHFTFEQELQGVPIYGSTLKIHVKNGNEIYAISGQLVTSQQIAQSLLSDQAAEEIVLEKARYEAPADIQLEIVKSQWYAFNPRLVGLLEREETFPALAVTISSYEKPITFLKRYFIDLTAGTIVYDENLIHEALNRRVIDCGGGAKTCTLARGEGDPPSNDTETNKTYDILGEVYRFYADNFGRDSYDGVGSSLDAYIHLTTQIPCPNAQWVGGTFNQMQICNKMVASDIISHEYNHAISQYTANLSHTGQAGALGEAIADVFGYALDSSDWSIGEETAIGVIRNIDDPSKPALNGNAPDRLFSPLYYCGSQDGGGIHSNAGVINKAFYLMTAGGSFNGCTISSITKEKSLPIFYRALTVYLTSFANFRSMYNSLLTSCNDLFQSASPECDEVIKTLQAVEIDQQTVGQQKGASCLGVQRNTPACALASTSTPIQTPTQTITQAPVMTNTPQPNCLLKFQGDSDCNGVIDLVDFEIWRKEATGSQNTKNANFNFAIDSIVDIIDFEIWRKGFYAQPLPF